MTRSLRKNQSGFTLAELAISVVIIGLLIGGLLGPIGRQVDQGRINETQKQMEFAREALLGFAVVNKRLPCPDTDGDGIEQATCTTAATAVGNLPWATLGLFESDAWGTRFRYAVSSALAVAPITLTSVGSLRVQQRNPATKAMRDLAGGAAPGAAAVIVSFGKNSFGGTLANGSAAGVARPNVPAVNADETMNAAAAAVTFSTRTPIDPSTPCSDTVGISSLCEFDDQVLWLSTPVVISRLVNAGQIP